MYHRELTGDVFVWNGTHTSVSALSCLVKNNSIVHESAISKKYLGGYFIAELIFQRDFVAQGHMITKVTCN
jgi:hypothetical protein